MNTKRMFIIYSIVVLFVFVPILFGKQDINYNNNENSYQNINNNENNIYNENDENISEYYSDGIRASLELFGTKNNEVNAGDTIKLLVEIINKSEDNYQFDLFIMLDKNKAIYFNETIFVDSGTIYNDYFLIETTDWPSTNSHEGSDYKVFVFGNSVISDNKKEFAKESFVILSSDKNHYNQSMIYGRISDSSGNPLVGAEVSIIKTDLLFNEKYEGKKCSFEDKKCKCVGKKAVLSGWFGIIEYFIDDGEKEKLVSSVVTDSKGFYYINLKKGIYKIITSSEGNVPKIEDNIIVENPGKTKRLDFRLMQGFAFSGTVLNQGRVPMANYIVAIELNGGIVRLRTDSEGKFKTYLLKGGNNVIISDPKVEIVVFKKYYAPGDIEIILETKVENANVIYGYITDNAMHKKITGSRALYIGLDNGLMIRNRIHPHDGRYSIKTSSQKGFLIADAPDHSMKMENIIFDGSSKVKNIDFYLYKGTNIYGKVTDKESGESIINAQVTALNESLSAYEKQIIFTDINGQYVFGGIDPVAKHIFAVADGYAFKNQEINISPDSSLEINFELEKAAEMYGIITDEEGNPISDVDVILENLADVSQISTRMARHAVTDETGFYSIDNIKPGENRVFINNFYNSSYEMMISDPINIVSSEKIEKNITLNYLKKLHIILKDIENNNPVIGASVTINPKTDGTSFAYPDCIFYDVPTKIREHFKSDSNGEVYITKKSSINSYVGISHGNYVPYYQDIIFNQNEDEKWVTIYLEMLEYMKY